MSIKQLLSDFRGIVRAPGMLLRSESSCYTANNVTMEAPGVIRKRKGFERKSQDAGGNLWQLYSSRLLADTFLMHVGNQTAPTVLKVSNGTSVTAVTAVDAGNVTRTYFGGKMHADTCQKNHYLTSDEGVRRLESDLTSGLLRYAGMPRGMVSPANVATVGTVLPDGYGRAYRVTWHRKDADGVELGGAPTARVVMRNIAGATGYGSATVNPTIAIYVPTEFGTQSTALTTSYFYRVWASLSFNLTNGEPDDELYLAGEAFLTGAQITAGVVVYTDSTPDDFLKSPATLHTNALNYPAGEEGLVQGVQNADEPPPYATDVCYWRDVMWFANTSQRAAQFFKLLTQPTAADTFTIGGRTFTAVAGAPAANQFQISTGFASINNDLEETAQRLVQAINIDTACTVSAYYLTGAGPPAAILLVAKAGAGFTSACSRANITRPDLNVAQTAGTDAHANYIAFSKPLRADAVPPQNYLAVGPGDNRIHRIMPLRDTLFVFTDYGIYKVTGSTFADFAVQPHDLTYTILVPESVVTCDDRLFAWCREGIVAIDDGGVSVISTPIEPLFEDLFGAISLDSFFYRGFAVAYNRRHRVQFFYPYKTMQAEVIMGCSRWLTYDTRTNVWTMGELEATVENNRDQRACGAVRWTDDQLALGTWKASSSNGYLMFERNAGNINDFQDTDSTGSSAAFTCTIGFNYMFPDTAGAAHWQRAVLHFEGSDLSSHVVPSLALSATFASDWTSTAETRTLASGDWATVIEVPAGVRRGQRFKFTLAQSQIDWLSLAGVDLVFADGDGKARRT